MSSLSTKYTEGNLHNNSGQALNLIGSRVWVGAENTFFPQIIANRDVGEFKQSADPGDGTTQGCVAALAYKLVDNHGKEFKWVVAWSNPEGPDSKVYTDLLDESFHWDVIKSELDKRGTETYKTEKFGYLLEISIPPKDRTATVKAYIEQPIVKVEEN